MNIEQSNSEKELNFLKEQLSLLLKSYKNQSRLPMADEFNRGWVSAFSCVAEDMEVLLNN